MELEKVYEQIQGDYKGVKNRLMTDERILKYLLKFTNKDMITGITSALEAKDFETAFREVHNLKGVCANLSLSKLESSAHDLTEALRGGEPTVDITPLLDAVESDYTMTMGVLNTLKE